MYPSACFYSLIFSCCLLPCLAPPGQMPWGDHPLVQIYEAFAKQMNLTNCWVCQHQHHGRSSLLDFYAIPGDPHLWYKANTTSLVSDMFLSDRGNGAPWAEVREEFGPSRGWPVVLHPQVNFPICINSRIGMHEVGEIPPQQCKYTLSVNLTDGRFEDGAHYENSTIHGDDWTIDKCGNSSRVLYQLEDLGGLQNNTLSVLAHNGQVLTVNTTGFWDADSNWGCNPSAHTTQRAGILGTVHVNLICRNISAWQNAPTWFDYAKEEGFCSKTLVKNYSARLQEYGVLKPNFPPEMLVRKHWNPHLTEPGLYFICGRRAYKTLPKHWKGICSVGYRMPAVKVVQNLTYLQVRNVGNSDHRGKRSLQDRPQACQTPFHQAMRVLFPGLSVYKLEHAIVNLSRTLENMDNQIIDALAALQQEIDSLSQAVLQNRMALDYLTLQQGGVCALVNSSCCTFVDQSGRVSTDVQKVKEQIQILRKYDDEKLID